MGGDWQTTSLGKLLTFSNGKSSPARDEEAKYSVFGSNGIIGNANEYNSPSNSIIIGRVGSYCGSVYISRTPCWVTDNAIKAVAKDENSALYLYYLLNILKLNQWREGSGQPLLNQSILKAIDVVVPKPNKQKAIANILGSLDDKIELNRQMNATLEAIAQALFKSWFVDFDPVIDNAIAAGNPIPEPFQARAAARQALGDKRKPLPPDIQKLFGDRLIFNDDLGWIPERWKISTIGDEIENTGGGTPNTKDPSYWEDGIHAFCTPKDMSALGSIVLTDTERYLTDEGVKKISSGQLPQGVVLLSSRAPIGYLAISNIPVSINQGIIALIPNNKYSSMYLLNWLHFNMSKIKDRANGSTFLEISKKNFRPIPFLIPNIETVVYFNKQAENLYGKLLLNSEQITALETLRDTLLPKLLSGQIRIPDAEALVAEAI